MKRALQIGAALLAVVAVAGIGWNGWEQHRQTEELTEQSCLAKVAAQNDVSQSGFGILFPRGLESIPKESRTTATKEIRRQFDRLDTC